MAAQLDGVSPCRLRQVILTGFAENRVVMHDAVFGEAFGSRPDAQMSGESLLPRWSAAHRLFADQLRGLCRIG